MPKYRSLPCSYEVIEGRRRNSRIYVSNGFGYVKSSLLGDKRMYLRCMESRQCHAKAVLALDSQMLFHKQPHNHPPSPENFIRIKLSAALKRKAEQTNTKVSKLYMDELKKMNIENPSALGLNYDKIAASMYKRRNKITKECNQGTASSRHFFGPPETLYDGNLPVVTGTTYRPKIDDHHLPLLSEDFIHLELGKESREEPTLHDRVEDKSPNNEVSYCTDHSMPGTSNVHSAPAEQLFNKTINVLKTKMPIASGDIHRGTQQAGSYQLQHNNHLHLVLSQLAQDEVFMDVTLTAEGKQIKAHKSVLSAVSPYFSAVLRANPCQHPIIIMPAEVRYEQLSSILSFIYRGKINIRADDLQPLMKVAELLFITGLMSKDDSNDLSIQNISNKEDTRTATPTKRVTRIHPARVASRAAQPQPPPHESCTALQEQNQKTNVVGESSSLHAFAVMSPSCSTHDISESEDDSDGFNSDFLDTSRPASPVGEMSRQLLSCLKEEIVACDETPEWNAKIPKQLHSRYKELTDLRKRSCAEQKSYSSSHNPQLKAAYVKILKTDLIKSNTTTNYIALPDVTSASDSASTTNTTMVASNSTNSYHSDDTCTAGDSIKESQPNICPYCGRFINNFAGHFMSEHVNKPVFVCQRCKRAYKENAELTTHEMSCS